MVFLAVVRAAWNWKTESGCADIVGNIELPDRSNDERKVEVRILLI